MRSLMRLGGCALVASFAVSCSQPSASVKTQSPSATATASSSAPASPAATLASFPQATDVTCPDLSSFGLDRYLERPADYNRHEAVLCDVHQLDRPLALHELDAGQTIGFLSSNVIGFLQQSGAGPLGASSVIKTLDLTTQAVKTVATAQSGFFGDVAWPSS